jgi:hypothetical protein
MLNYSRPLLDENGVVQKDKNGKVIQECKWGTVRLFNIKKLLDRKDIIISEGETDCMIAEQNGFDVVTVTCGAGTFKQDWAKLFKDKNVYICYDLDMAGKKGAMRVASFLRNHSASVKIVTLPSELGQGGDITDFFVKFKHTAQEFFEYVKNAKDYEKIVEEEEEIFDIRLPETTHAKYKGKKIRTEVLVNGKSEPAYMIPSRIVFYCHGSKKKCDKCVMLDHNCEYEYLVDPKKPEVLDLINISKERQEFAMRRIIGVTCEECKIELPEDEFINVEEIRVVPKVDMNVTSTDYVEKTVYYIGEGIKTNQHHIIEGYVFPEPRKQLSTIIVEKATPSMDSIESFEITDDIKQRLKIFQVQPGQKISDKIKEEYTDYERNVHHIWGRHDMMLAFDLVMHSPLYMKYDNEIIKGWVNAFIIGDTATGKTELISKMREHYGVGERIGGQGLTIPGLLGTVIQMDSGRWALRWGLLPMNDKRALIIEEVTDMPQDIMEKLTDVMSSGIVSVNKANGNEKTNARTRLLFVSNTKRGAKLESYGDGPSAIREIITKDEDIRRMDFILTIAKHEVGAELINRSIDNVPQVPHVYTSPACRDRIMWRWSRRPEQEVFNKDAELEIFKVSERMLSKYHDKFPLIETGDTKNKIRRLSLSLAGFLVSTDENFENVIVTKEHVLFIEWWLNSIYCKASMGYDLYSEDAKRKYNLTEKRRQSLIEGFKMLPEWETLLKVLWESQTFRKLDVYDRVGYKDKDSVRIVFKWMSQNWLIRALGSYGYRKENNFTTILRDLVQETATVSSEDDVYLPDAATEKTTDNKKRHADTKTAKETPVDFNENVRVGVEKNSDGLFEGE